MSSRQNRQRRSDRPWTVATAGAVLIAVVAAGAGCSEGPTPPTPVINPLPSSNQVHDRDRTPHVRRPDRFLNLRRRKPVTPADRRHHQIQRRMLRVPAFLDQIFRRLLRRTDLNQFRLRRVVFAEMST